MPNRKKIRVPQTNGTRYPPNKAQTCFLFFLVVLKRREIVRHLTRKWPGDIIAYILCTFKCRPNNLKLFLFLSVSVAITINTTNCISE